MAYFVCAESGNFLSVPDSNYVSFWLPAGLYEVFRGEAVTNLYRVVQETVNNILKHSQASRARIVLERDVRHVRLWIEDDGRGFGAGGPARAVTTRGFGLKNIAERVRILGGSLKVDSRPGAGTRVEAIVPIAESDSVLSRK